MNLRTFLWEPMTRKHFKTFMWLLGRILVSNIRTISLLYWNFIWFIDVLLIFKLLCWRNSLSLITLIDWFLFFKNLRVSLIVHFLYWLKVMLKLRNSLLLIFNHFFLGKGNLWRVLFKTWDLFVKISKSIDSFLSLKTMAFIIL